MRLKGIINGLFLIAITIVVSSCSTVVLVPGEYNGYIPEGHMAFANNSYTFYDDGRFSYSDYTDSSSDGLFSNYGEGTYTLDGNTLNLDYIEIDTLQSEIDIKKITCHSADTITYIFEVVDGEEKPIKEFVIIPEGINIDRLNKVYGENNGLDNNQRDHIEVAGLPNFYISKTDKNGLLKYQFLKGDLPANFKFRRRKPSSSPFTSAGVLNPKGMKIEIVDQFCKNIRIKARYQEHRFVSGDKSEIFTIKTKDSTLLMKSANSKRWNKMIRK